MKKAFKKVGKFLGWILYFFITQEERICYDQGKRRQIRQKMRNDYELQIRRRQRKTDQRGHCQSVVSADSGARMRTVG